MDKWQALYSFWAGFGVPAYEENSVPDAREVSLPYITYEAAAGGFEADIPASTSVWTRSPSWEQADALADTIHDALGGRAGGGKLVPYDGGAIWITPEDGFSRSMGDPDDDMIKRKVLSVILHYI